MVAHVCKNILCYTRYSIVQKLRNKQSAKVICRCDRLRTAHSKGKIAIRVMSNGKLISCPHNYTVLRINPGMTSYKDLAMVVDNSLDNN